MSPSFTRNSLHSQGLNHWNKFLLIPLSSDFCELLSVTFSKDITCGLLVMHSDVGSEGCRSRGSRAWSEWHFGIGMTFFACCFTLSPLHTGKINLAIVNFRSVNPIWISLKTEKKNCNSFDCVSFEHAIRYNLQRTNFLFTLKWGLVPGCLQMPVWSRHAQCKCPRQVRL